MVDQDAQGLQGRIGRRGLQQRPCHLRQIGLAHRRQPGRDRRLPRPGVLLNPEAGTVLTLQPQAFALIAAGVQGRLEDVVDMAAEAALLQRLPEQGDGAAEIAREEGHHPLAAFHIRQVGSKLLSLLDATARLLAGPEQDQLIRLPADQPGQGGGEQRLRPGGGGFAAARRTQPCSCVARRSAFSA